MHALVEVCGTTQAPDSLGVSGGLGVERALLAPCPGVNDIQGMVTAANHNVVAAICHAGTAQQWSI